MSILAPYRDLPTQAWWDIIVVGWHEVNPDRVEDRIMAMLAYDFQIEELRKAKSAK